MKLVQVNVKDMYSTVSVFPRLSLCKFPPSNLHMEAWGEATLHTLHPLWWYIIGGGSLALTIALSPIIPTL